MGITKQPLVAPSHDVNILTRDQARGATYAQFVYDCWLRSLVSRMNGRAVGKSPDLSFNTCIKMHTARTGELLKVFLRLRYDSFAATNSYVHENSIASYEGAST